MYKFKAIKEEDGPLVIIDSFHKMFFEINPGEYVIEIKPRDTVLESYKRHYFSQIDKLANYAGYVSSEDKKLFKKQLSEELGYSIKEINNLDDMKIRMEEVYKISSEHYGFLFEPYTPEENE